MCIRTLRIEMQGRLSDRSFVCLLWSVFVITPMGCRSLFRSPLQIMVSEVKAVVPEMILSSSVGSVSKRNSKSKWSIIMMQILSAAGLG